VAWVIVVCQLRRCQFLFSALASQPRTRKRPIARDRLPWVTDRDTTTMQFATGGSGGTTGQPTRMPGVNHQLWAICPTPHAWATTKPAPSQPDRRCRHHFCRQAVSVPGTGESRPLACSARLAAGTSREFAASHSAPATATHSTETLAEIV
jgi:hypothetical protein